MVPGGFSHRLLKLDTTSGAFAIKQLNPRVIARDHALDRFRASERVADSFRECGVRAVVALDGSRDPLRVIDGSWYLAYPWIAGATITLEDVTPEHARAVGATLGVRVSLLRYNSATKRTSRAVAPNSASVLCGGNMCGRERR